jgi:hypothetical protein
MEMRLLTLDATVGSGLYSVEGPINVFNPEPRHLGGIGLADGRPMVYGPWGGIVFDGTQINAAIDGYFYHEVIETAWGTMMAILAESNDDRMDDVVIEFNGNNEILRTMSLNTLLLGDKWGAVQLGKPYTPENWLHTMVPLIIIQIYFFRHLLLPHIAYLEVENRCEFFLL